MTTWKLSAGSIIDISIRLHSDINASHLRLLYIVFSIVCYMARHGYAARNGEIECPIRFYRASSSVHRVKSTDSELENECFCVSLADPASHQTRLPPRNTVETRSETECRHALSRLLLRRTLYSQASFDRTETFKEIGSGVACQDRMKHRRRGGVNGSDG
jgi:hypothetical protein